MSSVVALTSIFSKLSTSMWPSINIGECWPPFWVWTYIFIWVLHILCWNLELISNNNDMVILHPTIVMKIILLTTEKKLHILWSSTCPIGEFVVRSLCYNKEKMGGWFWKPTWHCRCCIEDQYKFMSSRCANSNKGGRIELLISWVRLKDPTSMHICNLFYLFNR